MLGLLQYRAWAIEESFFNRIVSVLAAGHSIKDLINKREMADYLNDIDALLMPIDPETQHANVLRDAWTGEAIIPTVKSGNKTIAIIPIKGAITKNGDACSYGTSHIQKFLATALKDTKVDGIVLLMDTPGGTVDGTPELALAVKNSSKPVGVFGDGVVASAGMWIAAQASVIVGNKNNPTQFGSIGAMRIVQNYAKAMAAGNMPEVFMVTAPQSTEKLPYDPTVPMSEEALAALKETARPMAQLIIDDVKLGRGDRLDTKAEGLFNGRMFDAQVAKSIGLIDSVGTLQTAVNKVAELSRIQKKSTVNGQQSTVTVNHGLSTVDTKSNMKFPILSALFSGEAWGKALSAFTDDESPLEAAEQKVATMEANLTKATEEKTAYESRATSAEAKVTELFSQVTTLAVEKAALEGDKAKLTEEKAALQTKFDAKLTGQATTVITGKKEEAQVNDDGSPSEVKSFRSKADDESDEYMKASAIINHTKK